jgi:sodium/bile acid cotransporter 2
MVDWSGVVTKVLLFVLVCCLSCTVDLPMMYKNRGQFPRGIAVAMACQFVLLPLLGFITVKIFALNEVEGVMLIILTASPGGSYSNWWCSILNADLGLSVACTAVSSIFSAATLPINILIYLGASYGQTIIESIAWGEIFAIIAIVITGVACGLAISWRLTHMGPRGHTHRGRLNLLGNVCGLVLIVLGFVFSSSSGTPLWSRPLKFYFAFALPALLAFPLSFALASLPIVRLTRPQRVAVGAECIFQNIGIAISIAISMYDDETVGRAVFAPLWYGVAQSVLLPLQMLILWKLGFTHAPPSASLWRVVTQSWQPTCDLMVEGEGVGVGAGAATARAPAPETEVVQTTPLRKVPTSGSLRVL